MDMPEFPQEFVDNHCLLVLDARYWRKKHNQSKDLEEERAFAQCEFEKSGFGMKCQNCKLFICSTPPNNPADKFLPAIQKYYKDSEEYDKVHENAHKDIGAYI